MQHHDGDNEEAQLAPAFDQVAAPVLHRLGQGQQSQRHRRNAQHHFHGPACRESGAQQAGHRADDEREPEQAVPRRQAEGIVEGRAREQPEDRHVAGADFQYGCVPNRLSHGMARCGANGIGGGTDR
jgi:hypothetical protein